MLGTLIVMVTVPMYMILLYLLVITLYDLGRAMNYLLTYAYGYFLSGVKIVYLTFSS